MRTSNATLSDHMRNGTTTASDSGSIVVVDCRRLVRESLVHCISEQTKLDVIGVQSIDEWIELSKTRHGSLFMLAVSSSSRDDAIRKVQRMLEVAEDVPTAVLSDEQDLTSVVELLACGVRGCIPTDISLDVAIAALGLIRAGGTFVPAGIVMKGSAPAVTNEGSAPAVTQRRADHLITQRHVHCAPGCGHQRAAAWQTQQVDRLHAGDAREHGQGPRAQHHEKDPCQEPDRSSDTGQPASERTALTSSRAAARACGPPPSVLCE